MQLQPNKSYAIILDQNTQDNQSSFAVNMTMRYIIDINLQAGITLGQNIFGGGMSISDTQYPNRDSIVISRTDRKHQDFILLDLSEHKWGVLFQILNIPDTDGAKELTKFVKANLKHEKSLEILYYRVSAIVSISYSRTNDKFDLNKAKYALDTFKEAYKNNLSNRTEQLIATINFIKNPNEMLLFEMLKAYSNDFRQISSNIQAVAEDRLPKNIINMFQDVLSSALFTKNVLQIMSYIVVSEDYNDFTLNCLRMIK